MVKPYIIKIKRKPYGGLSTGLDFAAIEREQKFIQHMKMYQDDSKKYTNLNVKERMVEIENNKNHLLFGPSKEYLNEFKEEMDNQSLSRTLRKKEDV